MAKIRVTVSDLSGKQVETGNHVVISMRVNGRAMQPIDVRSEEIPELLKVAVPRTKRQYNRKPLTDGVT